MENSINSKAYEFASNLSLKSIKRDIIENGKECYLEGYHNGYGDGWLSCREKFVGVLKNNFPHMDINGILDAVNKAVSDDLSFDNIDELISYIESRFKILVDGNREFIKLNNFQIESLKAVFFTDADSDKEVNLIGKRGCGLTICSCIIACCYMLLGKRVLIINPFWGLSNEAYSKCCDLMDNGFGLRYRLPKLHKVRNRIKSGNGVIDFCIDSCMPFGARYNVVILENCMLLSNSNNKNGFASLSMFAHTMCDYKLIIVDSYENFDNLKTVMS